ncbi:MAG: GHKL domain-containing protein [Spirochaetales bacterium]|nr:GHKL domain-containing protein [Spirochaetales bacterium]
MFLSLLLMEIIILLFRFSTCNYKHEFLLFLLVIIFLALKTFFSHLFFLGIGSSLILVYVTGNFIYTLSPGRYNYLWSVSVGLVSMIIVILMILNLTGSVYFSFFYLYITAVLFLYPLRQLWRLYTTRHLKIMLYLFITSILLIIAKTIDLVSMIMNWFFIDMTLWISICLITGLGYFIFQKGYLIQESAVWFTNKSDKKNNILHTVFSRMVQTEDTLLLQDRLITSGLLSVGTSHEFKNILTHIKTMAQFGLTQKTGKKKNAALESLLENAEHGIHYITEYFKILALRIEEKPIIINMKKTLLPLIKLVRISYRNYGISFFTDISDNVIVFAGRGELEQVVLNLIRNAVDSIKKEKGREKKIELKAHVLEDQVIMDIIDNGRGIPAHLCSTIFEPHFSLKQSSGLGLYLVKMLVLKNKGSIEYLPGDPGACFRLIFPLYKQS